MSEEERSEYAYHADELERMRKEGLSLEDIGVQRVKSRQPNLESGSAETGGKLQGEHLEISQT
jgi:hypothetical protein